MSSQAFEDSLDAHTRELQLKQGLLESVHGSREQETAALSKMRIDIKASL